MADKVNARRVAPTDGRDPDVKVPSRVRQEAERAEALLRASQGGDENQPEGDAGEQGGITLVPQQSEASPFTSVVTDAPPATPPAPAAPAAPANPQDRTRTEHEFNSMKGRAERYERDTHRLSEEVTNLRNVIATMQAAPPAPAAPAQQPAELQAQSLLTPQEIADYGPEFLDVVGKKAREIAGSEIASLKQQIENLSRGMQTTTQMSMEQARSAMLANLDEKLPEWRTLNTDQNFLAWLRLPDPFSGAIRQDLLKTAYDQNQTARVQAFFQGFLAEEAAVAPANAPPAQRPSAAQPSRVPLETFAAPGRAKSAAANAPAEKPIITRQQVTQFYADVAAGKYRGREAEKDANEIAIFSATNEGRLR